MKKTLLAAVALCACALSFQACKSNGGNAQQAQEPMAIDQPATPASPYAGCPKVYSNAYDGFTNIRAEASSKAPVIGKFRNGPEGAYLINQEDKWSLIACDGVEGYVYTKYVTLTPTVECQVDLTSGWLNGMWVENNSNNLIGYEINKNGTYKYYNYLGVGYVFSGVWHIEGKFIVLKETKRPDDFEEDVSSGRYFLNDQTHAMQDHHKGRLDSDCGA